MADFRLRPAVPEDSAFWLTRDGHISREALASVLRDGRGYLLECSGEPVGVLRYGLFWDSIPFLHLLTLDEDQRGQGVGRAAMLCWEAEMAARGYTLALTSTQADEQAQHFYRKLGYEDAGCLLLPPDMQAPAELLLRKALRALC